MIDLPAARAFVAENARLLERRRLALLLGEGGGDAVVRALAAHRNPDGGIGWALEPELRSATSQPVGALHAFELLDEAGAPDHPLGRDLADWLGSVSTPDGGLPFALPGVDDAPHAPWWAPDPSPSLHITSAVAAAARRLGTLDDHPWLVRAVAFCRARIAELREPTHAIELRYVLGFLDVVGDDAELARLHAAIPADGVMPVAVGVEGEALRALDFSPLPDRPLRALFDPAVVERDLDRLEADQRDDGGWDFTWARPGPLATLEWRGIMTVEALRTLRANGRV